MRTSRAGLELIKSFEGFRDTAVRLPDGRHTIGYGHMRTAREGLTISEKDAEDLLVYDLHTIETALNSMVFAPLNQNQFDALVSLTYNISPGQFRDSEILAYLNAGDFLSAANAFDVWRKARIHGRVMVVDALVRRRAAEKAMFLEHPDGRPTAPTPLVPPTRDTEDTFARAEAKPRPAARYTEPQAAEEPIIPPQAQPQREPPVDIAEAVRRLAERTNEIIAGGRPVPPPIEDAEFDAEFEAIEPSRAAEPVETVEPEEVLPEPEPEPEPRPQAPQRTASDIDAARRAVAERVAKILERTERAIEEQRPEPTPQPRAEKPAEPVKPVTKAAQAPKPAKIFGDIPEDLPDFDKPAEPRIKPAASSNGRKLIDDTETFDPGRDPAQLFVEAEQKAKVVNGRSKNLGLINGRWASLWPFAFILVLAVVGFSIGLVDTFGNFRSGSALRGANIVLAVFGMLMLTSLYFIITRANEND
ncbi:MAG TPA: glycoside hydrolase family protein [Hyphomonadaceae bacterium]|nr:glycoside hydrolase family protein [Hyphomonadaceae bacterium]